MRKIPIAILTCVVIFVGVVVGVLLTRSRGPLAQPASEPAPTKADYRIKEIHLQEEGKNATRWQLDAEYGEMFEAQGKTALRKVQVRVEEPARVWTVSADEGEMQRESKDVELRGRVVLTTSDGLRLETERLAWTAKEERAWTDAPVTIYRGGVVVHGRGFESRVNEGATTIRGRLRAVLNPRELQAEQEKRL
jgi:LPS export ABC transporter protein LptC